jgi:hypothetical protein
MTEETVAQRTTIGVSRANHEVLEWLQSEGYFPQMMDACKFAMALGLAYRERTQVENRKTLTNVGSFDPDKSIHTLLEALLGELVQDPYRVAEEYADWGLNRMRESMESGDFRFVDYFEAVDALNRPS